MNKDNERGITFSLEIAKQQASPIDEANCIT
jgi:hypothetical protein